MKALYVSKARKQHTSNAAAVSLALCHSLANSQDSFIITIIKFHWGGREFYMHNEFIMVMKGRHAEIRDKRSHVKRGSLKSKGCRKEWHFA